MQDVCVLQMCEYTSTGIYLDQVKLIQCTLAYTSLYTSKYYKKLLLPCCKSSHSFLIENSLALTNVIQVKTVSTWLLKLVSKP